MPAPVSKNRPPTSQSALFVVRCGYKDCTQHSEPQPDEEAMEKWLRDNRWKHVEGKDRCPWCVLATRPNQGRWGPEK